MSRGLPEPGEERWMALAERYPQWRETRQARDAGGGWKTATPRSRIGFFLLGLFIGSQSQSLLFMLSGASILNGSSLPGLCIGLLTIAVAEWLIARRRLFHSGLEEGLWLAGIESICIALLPRLYGAHQTLAIALPAAMLLLAGLRLLNPLAVTAGALVSTAAFASWLEQAGWRQDPTPVSLYCLGIALLALAAGLARRSRPAHDDMFDQLVVVMPVAGYLWAVLGARHTGFAALVPVLLPLLTATLYFIVGISRRWHAPLIGMLACKLCLVWELRDLTDLPLRWKLIAWGALALLACVAIDRWLRKPRAGITTADLGDDAESTLFPDVARAALLTPLQPPTSPAPYHGEGGGFGGGGANGRF